MSHPAQSALLEARPPARQLLSYLAPYGPHVSNPTLALRDLVLEEAPQAIESISKGYAFGDRLFVHRQTAEGRLLPHRNLQHSCEPRL